MTKYHLNNIQGNDQLPAKLRTIISTVKTQLDQTTQPGHYPLSGDHCFYFIVEENTQPISLTRSEIHRRYIDIQIVLEGEETFGYSNKSPLRLESDLLDEKDVAFCAGVEDEQFLTLSPSEFMVFLPGQPHRPMVARHEPGPVKKAVIKVDQALLAE